MQCHHTYKFMSLDLGKLVFIYKEESREFYIRSGYFIAKEEPALLPAPLFKKDTSWCILICDRFDISSDLLILAVCEEELLEVLTLECALNEFGIELLENFNKILSQSVLTNLVKDLLVSLLRLTSLWWISAAEWL